MTESLVLISSHLLYPSLCSKCQWVFLHARGVFFYSFLLCCVLAPIFMQQKRKSHRNAYQILESNSKGSTDYKIVAKAIANRIELVLPNLINNDQSGFIKDRFIPGLLLFIDFEKAFDSLEWSFQYI